MEGDPALGVAGCKLYPETSLMLLSLPLCGGWWDPEPGPDASGSRGSSGGSSRELLKEHVSLSSWIMSNLGANTGSFRMYCRRNILKAGSISSFILWMAKISRGSWARMDRRSFR